MRDVLPAAMLACAGQPSGSEPPAAGGDGSGVAAAVRLPAPGFHHVRVTVENPGLPSARPAPC